MASIRARTAGSGDDFISLADSGWPRLNTTSATPEHGERHHGRLLCSGGRRDANRGSMARLRCSRARGDTREDSDYDAAVLLTTLPGRWRDLDRLAQLRVDMIDATGAFLDARPCAASACELNARAWTNTVRNDPPASVIALRRPAPRRKHKAAAPAADDTERIPPASSSQTSRQEQSAVAASFTLHPFGTCGIWRWRAPFHILPLSPHAD